MKCNFFKVALVSETHTPDGTQLTWKFIHTFEADNSEMPNKESGFGEINTHNRKKNR